MLRINSLQSASDYYTKSLTKGDYYSEQSEINGKWAGSLVKELGLGDEVKKSEFDNLCAGRHPYTGEKLTSRLSSDRREAYDFTFSVPKSVSLLGAITRNSEIERVITESVTETMKLVEQNTQCRVRENGKQENRVTGNMVYGYFLHRNSRPIDGYSDPQLHVHAVVLNLTFDKVENKWKAVEVRDKIENREYYNAIFNSTLALKLKDIGITVEKRRGDFEITGITDKTIETFSRRTDTINKEAEIKNIFNPDLKGELGARTRHSKNDKHSQSQLREIYLRLLSPEQKSIIEEHANMLKMQTSLSPNQETEQLKQVNKQRPSPQTLKHLDYTLEKAFERHSSMSEQRLIGAVLKEGVGEISLEQVNRAIAKYKEDNILVSELKNPKNTLEIIQSRNNLSPAITTRVALIEEVGIVESVNLEKMHWTPINSTFARNIDKDTFLNQNQKLVIAQVLTSRDGINILEGKAGTGKTTILKEIQKGIKESNDYQELIVLAPTTKAVEVLQTEGFPNAMTIQKYLIDIAKDINTENVKQSQSTKKSRTKPDPSYIIVDEASLVSVRQMNKLLKYTTKNDQRVLLVGDTKQHKSVERGNTLQTIIDHSKIEVFSLHQIQRQKESEAKQAVELLAKGQTIQGINQFQKLGYIKEIENDQQRLEQVARLYIQNLPKVYVSKVGDRINTTDEDKNNSHLEKLENQSWLQKMGQSVGQKIFGQDINGENLKNQNSENEIKRTEEQSKTNLSKERKVELDYFGQVEIDGQEIKKIQYEKLNPQQNTLVITPTHLDGQNIHTAIRQKLKTEELIDQQDHKIETLRSLSWTSAEKAKESNYEIGQVLQFTGNKLDFKKGERYEIVTEESKGEEKNQKLDKNPKEKLNLGYFNELKPKQNETNEKLLIKNLKTKEIKSMPIELNSYFDVFQKESITISKGDLIQCQRQTIVQDKKDIEHKTTNGATYQIKHISPRTGDITLSNDWILPKDFGNLKSAYYSTSHASQGQTVNHSIFYTSNHSQHLLNQDMVYVANSRFRLSNTILTPNLEQFKQYAQKPDPKTIALSVIQDKQNSIGNKLEDQNKVENKIEDKLNKEIKPEPYISFSARQEPLPIDTNRSRMRMRR